jgi:hypothetical protein
MARLIESCRFGGTCIVCEKPFAKGDPIWHVGYNQAMHPECKELEREYIFATRDGGSTFDRLSYSKVGEMLTKAFELSAENNQPVGVNRLDGTKLVPLFMISALPGASLVPAPEPEPLEIDGPLFPWPEGKEAPF